MECKRCGYTLEEGMKECPACGYREGGDDNKVLKIVISVLSVLLLAAVITIVVLMNVKKDDNKSNDSKSGKGKKENTAATVPTDPTEETGNAETTDTTEETEETETEPTTGVVVPAVSYSATDDEVRENRDAVVAKVGDYELTVAQLQLYYWFQVSQYYTNNQEYIYYGYITLDLLTPLDEQECTENPSMTWQQYFLTKALNAWSGYATMNMMADEADIQLPDDLMDSLKADFLEDAQAQGYETAEEYVEEMLRSTVGGALTADDYWQYLAMENRATLYFGQWYENATPTAGEVAEYYEAHSAELEESGYGKDAGNVVDVRHILITTENGDWAASEKKANDILKMWQDGAATEEFFAELANEYSEDTGSNTAGGLYTDVVSGQMVEVFNDWIMDSARQPGDTAVLKADYHYQGYHVMYFVQGQPIWEYVAREELLGERSTAMVQEGKDKWPITCYYDDIKVGMPEFEVVE